MGDFDNTPTSRFEEIMRAIIDGTEYSKEPRSVMEALLIELKETIEAGGGGGGGTSTIAWKPSVALDGTISWTRTASETKPDDQNIKGPKGDDGEDGLGIKQVSINLENHLIITYDDDTTEDAGVLPEGGSSTLSDLTDTVITSPTDGQVLTYNSATGKWENADGGETKDTVKYEFVTKSTGGQNAAITVSKYLNGVLDSSTDYSYNSINNNPTIIDGYISFVYKSQQTSWEYTILKDSLSGHSVGYSYSWSYSATIDAEEEFYISEDTLAGLNDVAVVSPTASQPLTYNPTNSMWINGGVIPIANGGTGNNTGYVQAGRKANTNIGNNATAEGQNTTASGNQSHAEGYSTQATGRMAHAEGESTKATNGASHAEGANTTASGNSSHAQGTNTTASGAYSSAAGRATTAGYSDQFVVGKYNDNKSTNIFEVGIGTGSGATPKINGLELDTSGNLKVASAITSGGNIVSNGFIEDSYGHRLGYSKRSKIDPFPEGASAITFYNTNGVTISSSSITDGVGSLTATEAQAGYEGFVIELNVTPGKLHVVSFDYQNIDCEYWTNPTYMLGWTLDNSAKTNYQNIELWSNNIERNATSQHFEATITPSGNKVYLNFDVCGYSDSRSNTFSLSNLTVYELVEDTGEPDALSDLSDTAISSPSDGQILGYNGTSRKWENTTPTIPDISVKQNITLATPLSIGGVSRTTVESALGALANQASYLEQTVTLSTSASTTVTFTDAKITANSFIEYACSQWDLVPESITGAAGSCTIVLPKVDSAQSVTVRIYVR